MEFPYKIIEGKITEREEFEMTDGYQPTWALFYMKRGSFRISLDGRDEIISDGDCVLLPDDIRFSRSVLEPIAFVYIKFRPDRKCPFSLPLPVGRIEFADKARFTSSILSYERLIGSNDSRSRAIREHLFADMLYQIYIEQNPSAGGDLCSDENTENCRDALVLAAAEYIRGHLRRELTLDSLCRSLGTNQSTLNFRFRRELGCSVGNFIISARMRQAKRLLIGTNYTIGAVAERCGYENIYYFSTAFRKVVGCSPSEYRRKYQ